MKRTETKRPVKPIKKSGTPLPFGEMSVEKVFDELSSLSPSSYIEVSERIRTVKNAREENYIKITFFSWKSANAIKGLVDKYSSLFPNGYIYYYWVRLTRKSPFIQRTTTIKSL